MQSTVTTPTVGPRKVTTFVVGQMNPSPDLPELVQVVATVMAGVANVIAVCAGQVIVMGVVAAGKVIVDTPAELAVTVEVSGVKYVDVLAAVPGD